MHLHFERSTNAKCDCSIVSLSWMGKVPDNVPEVSLKLVSISFGCCVCTFCCCLISFVSFALIKK